MKKIGDDDLGYHDKGNISCPICATDLVRRANFDVADVTEPDTLEKKYDMRYDSALCCPHCFSVFPTYYDTTADPKQLFEVLDYVVLDKTCPLCKSRDKLGMAATIEGCKPDFGDITSGHDDKPERVFNIRYTLAEICLNTKCGYIYPYLEEVYTSQKVICPMCRKDHLISARKADLRVAEITPTQSRQKRTIFYLTYDSALVCDCCAAVYPTHYGKTLSEDEYDDSIDFSMVVCDLCGSRTRLTKFNTKPDFADIRNKQGAKVYDVRFDQAVVCTNPDCSIIRPFKRF